MSLQSDLPKALTGVWLVVSALAITAVIVPCLAAPETVLGLFPICEAKARGSSCLLCGMTTGFVLLAHGDLSGARAANPGAPYLFFGFIANFVAANAYLTSKLLRRHTTGDHRTCKLSL